MAWDKNVYYNPEKFGLSVVAELEYSSGWYEFDTRVVWLHAESGAFYTARDSGCSCPTPFEDYEEISALDRLDVGDLEREYRAEVDKSNRDVEPGAVMDFLSTVREAVWLQAGGVHGNAPLSA